MDKLADVLPCVNFEVVPPGSQPSGDYVHIVKGSGCWSYVGRLGGKQQLSLQSPGCTGVGTIMHEMIHALGFYHEQSRPDRDDYVNILWDNISPGMENNFVKRSASQVTTFGVPYNTRSIMHYSSRAFSKNGQPTITAKVKLKSRVSKTYTRACFIGSDSSDKTYLFIYGFCLNLFRVENLLTHLKASSRLTSRN